MMSLVTTRRRLPLRVQEPLPFLFHDVRVRRGRLTPEVRNFEFCLDFCPNSLEFGDPFCRPTLLASIVNGEVHIGATIPALDGLESPVSTARAHEEIQSLEHDIP